MYSWLRMKLHEWFGWHWYDFRDTVDHYPHEGAHWIKIKTWTYCRLCDDTPPSCVNVEWRILGSLKQFPIDG